MGSFVMSSEIAPHYSMEGDTHVVSSIYSGIRLYGKSMDKQEAIANYEAACESAMEVLKKPKVLWPVGITIIG